MGLSLWSLIGTAAGVVVGYANYAFIMGVIEPRLRALDRSESEEERAAFERKIVLMRRIMLAFEIAVFAGTGYFIGAFFIV